ncbi:beta-galactosidase [Bacillus sp. H-16]|uniref:beta-galactosidase n=1 Tax=Alteribacter salitolerans TaxID=2912333 RepID=UPI001964A696|nr:beta-galactosidase [Alteribacter salitolerans]MBM7097890.1 beta-galactosidase [Alteribacter salitolerans]
MIEVKDECIMINGEEVILYGAELHYFRVPRDLWRERIRQVKEAGINMVSTYVPWIFHEYEEGNTDLTGETLPERDLVSFLELIKEEGLYCLVRPGPYVMAEIVDHGVPTWFIENYPQAVAKTKDGEIHPTRVVSYLHENYLEKVNLWYDKVCEVISPFQADQGGPVILFQIDNEVGMFHWVTNTGDYNDVTLHQFEHFLNNKYTLSTFQEKFNTTHTSVWEFLKENIREPQKIHSHRLRYDYSLFMRNHYRNYLKYVRDLAKDKGITVPFIVNIHGFHTIDLLKRGSLYPIGISQLLEAAKLEGVMVAGDYYIGNIEYDSFIDIVLANAFTKAIQWKQQPLFSAEFQGGTIPDKPRLQPTTYDLTTRLCFANGMNAANYYMFVGGENYEGIGILGRRHGWQAPLTMHGEKKPHFQKIQHLGEMFRVFEKQLASAKQQVNTHLGFYPDYYMTEFYDKHTEPMIKEIEKERDINLYNGAARGLRLNNITFDAIDMMDENEIDVDDIPVLWMFATKWMDESVQRKLITYLENGGHLVLFPVMPVKTMNNEPCSLLKDFIGVRVTGTKEGGFVDVFGVDNVKVDGMEFYDVSEGVLGWEESDDKQVIAFEKPIAKGKVMMVGVSMENDYEYKNEIYRQMAAKTNVKSSFLLSDELDVSVRSVSHKGLFVFLNNFDEYEKKTTVSYLGELLFEGNEIKVPFRGGLMLPVNIPLSDELLIKYGTGEIVKMQQGNEWLTITVKVVQKEEIFVFESKNYIPLQQNDLTIVEGELRHSFKVSISSSQEYETVLFVKQ